MQSLEASGAVQPLYGSLGVKGLTIPVFTLKLALLLLTELCM